MRRTGEHEQPIISRHVLATVRVSEYARLQSGFEHHVDRYRL
jgi:hypothetical protein